MRRPKILARLRGVKKSGAGWLAFCPSHNDQQTRSLSVGIGDDGRTLLHCFTGCQTERVVTAVGMTLADLGPDAAPTQPARLTLAAFARAKGLEEAFLREHGVHEDGDSLVIPYRLRDGSLAARQRRRSALIAGDGSSWEGPLGMSPVAYGLWRLEDAAEKGVLLLVEGETDTLTGWRHNIPTLGIPGADMLQTLTPEALTGLVRLDVLQEPDRGGTTFVRRTAARLHELGWTGPVFAVRLPAKDLNALHLTAGDHFAAEMLTATAAALPLATAARDLTDASPRGPSEAQADMAAATAEPILTPEGEDYRLTWADGIALHATALRESSGEVHAELTVLQDETVLSWGWFNLASTPAREGLVKKLLGAAATVPRWRERLEVACRTLTAQVRLGAPLECLRPAPRPAVSDLIADVLPLGETSIVYADGDSGKGWWALAAAVVLLTGQALPHLRPTRRVAAVAYLDWETTASEIAARVDALCRGLGVALPPQSFWYRPMTRALADDAARLRGEFVRRGVELIIVDSFVPACGTEPEGADATIRCMNALRTFTGATRLVQAHVNRLDADKTHGATRPWGSVFVRNLARATWELKRPAPDGDDLVLGCYLTKRNDAPRGAPPWGLRFQFRADGAVVVADEPLTRAPGLLAKATVWQQIHAALLSHGPQTAEAVALTLDAHVKTVRRTLERHRDLGYVVTPKGHDPLVWSLVSPREPR